MTIIKVAEAVAAVVTVPEVQIVGHQVVAVRTMEVGEVAAVIRVVAVRIVGTVVAVLQIVGNFKLKYMAYSNKLYDPARRFLNWYTLYHGVPDKSNREYWDLKNACDSVYNVLNQKGKRISPNRKELHLKTFFDRIILAQLLLSCCVAVYKDQNGCIVAEVATVKGMFDICIAFNKNGAVKHVFLMRDKREVGREEIYTLIEYFKMAFTIEAKKANRPYQFGLI